MACGTSAQMPHKWAYMAVQAADVHLFETPHFFQKGNQFPCNRGCKIGLNLVSAVLQKLLMTGRHSQCRTTLQCLVAASPDFPEDLEQVLGI